LPVADAVAAHPPAEAAFQPQFGEHGSDDGDVAPIVWGKWAIIKTGNVAEAVLASCERR
jgi:hypothetical protein